MADYQGMRWLKCDFQVQTPEDGAHWADGDTKLTEPRRPMEFPVADANGIVGPAKPNEQRMQEVARAYLRQCHAVGLELIGVTDHNFSQKGEPRDWFLTHLVEQNKSVANELGREPLFILPGFEVDIGYHVLCLFEPAKKASNVWRVNRLLCKLGLDEGERFKQGRPMPLRRNNANVSLKELIELVQDQHKGIVIAAHSDQHDGLLSDPRHLEDYKNQKLLALEVTSNPPANRILDIIEGRDKAWARSDCHPAYVMSSDAKSLKLDEHGAPVANSLGYRYTWLKVSKPSIEALRQAFLDPLSRVQLLGARPSDAQMHPRITGISVRGAKFLENQELILSEGLNCVIGGRGSGKSSLLEYLRFAIGLDQTTAPDRTTALGRKREQLKESLSSPGAEVRVAFQAEGGVPDILVYTPSTPVGPKRRIEGRDVSDLETVLRQLRVQFFSQGELSRMTGDGGGQAQVLALIDASSGKPLIDLQAREQGLQVKLRTLFQARRDEQRLAADISTANQEAVELERQLVARAAVQGDSMRSQFANKASWVLDDFSNGTQRDSKAVADLIDALVVPEHNLLQAEPEWPAAEWFNTTFAKVHEARRTLKHEISRALAQYQHSLSEAIGIQATSPVREAIEVAQEQFRVACLEKGIHPDDIVRVQGVEDARQEKLRHIEVQKLKLAEVMELSGEFLGTLASLHEVWKQQFQLRSETAKEIQDSVASQTVRVKTTFMQDKSSFLTEWRRLAPKDGRGKLARRWEELGDDVFQSWLVRETEASPWETVEVGRTDPRAILYFTGATPGDDLQPALIAHISSEDVVPIWEVLRTTRIGDGIDVELLRDDQSPAGTMSGALSEGQRNTVLLNLMLARGDGPIVIDQPEDELDSSFIYKTLVKDLRAVKQKRQLIIATHNANLPVNGDAELIYALEARDGKGKMLAEGGLDRAQVARAVLDIMEGSEQAFKRRGEKYHF
jgi:ABC-type lipoprotein export system ATPase subunit